jgi:hypothetical protein
MSWYFKFDTTFGVGDLRKWVYVDESCGLPNSGPYATKAMAEKAILTRATETGSPLDLYKAEGEDDVPAGPEHGIPAKDVPAMLPANPKQAYGDKKVPMHTVPPALMIGAAKARSSTARSTGARSPSRR